MNGSKDTKIHNSIRGVGLCSTVPRQTLGPFYLIQTVFFWGGGGGLFFRGLLGAEGGDIFSLPLGGFLKVEGP